MPHAWSRSIEEFKRGWNQQHPFIQFSILGDPDAKQPIGIEVRFSPTRFEHPYGQDRWEKLETGVKNRSHNMMWIISNRDLFLNGIISVALASGKDNFSHDYIVNTMEWLGEEFIPG